MSRDYTYSPAESRALAQLHPLSTKRKEVEGDTFIVRIGRGALALDLVCASCTRKFYCQYHATHPSGINGESPVILSPTAADYKLDSEYIGRLLLADKRSE